MRPLYKLAPQTIMTKYDTLHTCSKQAMRGHLQTSEWIKQLVPMHTLTSITQNTPGLFNKLIRTNISRGRS
jgi:hypothetical protein